MRSTRALPAIGFALILLVTSCGGRSIPEASVSETSTTTTGTAPAPEPTTPTTAAAPPTTTTTEPGRTEGPATFEELTHSPLIIQQGDIRIVFDQWFFSTFDPNATVTVEGPDGVLTEGLVAGSGAVMREDPPGLMHFYDPAGNEVAELTSEELFRAADEARQSAGL